MNLAEKLEIFLITYNRSVALKKTLAQLLSPSSPVQNISIHVLDNASPDDTSAVVTQFTATHPNLHYIRHKYNVGLGGNLIKAMEMASKPYFWIVCDDDDWDWTAWPEVETALFSNKYDIIMTTHTAGFRNETIPYLINEMCFVPSAIYKTAHIDDQVMTNAYAMTHNLFPFHALSTKIINQRGNIFVPKGRVVLQSYGHASHRSIKLRPGVYRRLQTFALLWGMLDAYSLLEDKKLRFACMNVLCLGHSFFASMLLFLIWFPFTWQNFFDAFCYVSTWQKLQLLFLAIVKIGLIVSPISFYIDVPAQTINFKLFWGYYTHIVLFSFKK